MPVTLGDLTDAEPTLLPREFAATVMETAFQNSVVGRLTPSEPISMGETIIPIYEGGIEAGVVGEGEPKPVSEPSMGTASITPIKLATIVLVSREAARVNPGRMLDLIQGDMTNAITRAVDLGILHGRSAKTGNAIPSATFVNQTTNRVVLGDDIGSDVLEAFDFAAEDHDPDGIAADTRLRSKLVTARDANGNSVFQASTNLAAPVDNVWGLPTAYGRVVSARIGASADTGVRAFIGDWSQVRWGYAETITVSRSTEATVVDGETTYHLWQQNMIGLLVEAIVGWTVLNTDAFAALDSETASA